MEYLRKFFTATFLFVVLSVPMVANAAIVNTLNGVDYEWLELTATAGMSRLDVEAQLSDVNSALYGYEFASRGLVEDLFLSYSSWDGIIGWHGDSAVVTGMEMFLDDFGRTVTYTGDGDNVSYTTTDGYTVQIDGYTLSRGYYGNPNECATVSETCYTDIAVYRSANGTPTMAIQSWATGWDSHSNAIYLESKALASIEIGSHLVRSTAVVPVPAAVWLFGSGLLGLIGLAKRKRYAK